MQRNRVSDLPGAKEEARKWSSTDILTVYVNGMKQKRTGHAQQQDVLDLAS